MLGVWLGRGKGRCPPGTGWLRERQVRDFSGSKTSLLFGYLGIWNNGGRSTNVTEWVWMERNEKLTKELTWRNDGVTVGVTE